MNVRKEKRAWLLTGILMIAIAARILYPVGAAYLRAESARLLASDLENLAWTEAVGRAFAENGFGEELIAAIKSRIIERQA